MHLLLWYFVVELHSEPKQNNSIMERQLKTSSGFELFLFHVMYCMFVFLAFFVLCENCSLTDTFDLFNMLCGVECHLL